MSFPAVPHHNPLCKELCGLLVGPGTKPDAEDGNGCGQDDNGYEMAGHLEGLDALGIGLAHFLDRPIIIELLVGPEPDDPTDVANRKKWVGAIECLP